MDNRIEQFKALIQPWISAYDRMAIAAMGIHENGKDTLLSARIVLAPSVGAPYKVPALKTTKLWATAQSISFSREKLSTILRDVENGVVRIGAIDATLELDHTNKPNLGYQTGPHSAHGGNQSAPRIATLTSTGSFILSALGRVLDAQTIDWHLRSLSPPFSDLADLHVHFGLPAPNQAGDNSLIEIIARPPVEMDGRSTIENGMARIRVIAASKANRQKISVGIRAILQDNPPLRSIVKARDLSWSKVNKIYEGEANVNIVSARAVQCFVSYAGAITQQFWIIDPKRLINPRLAIHSAFDDNLQILKRLLFETKKSDSRSFEDGVAMLLGLLGFSVTQHGRSKKLSDAADIVALTPTGHVAMVECTIGLPDQDDQVAKALQRAEALRKSLELSGWPGIQIMPVIVTPLAEAEIHGHRKTAEGQGVAVACLENIQQALTQVYLPPDADRLFTEAMQRRRTSSLGVLQSTRNSLI